MDHRFRPLIRGLSISSHLAGTPGCPQESFPSPHPGIINFFGGGRAGDTAEDWFPSPHPGIINFFAAIGGAVVGWIASFRPLIRGLSISSSGVFSNVVNEYMFPSPHPGIINFFNAERFNYETA